MEKVTVSAKYAVRGNVRAELLWSNEPISFWGTVDPQSGLIRDKRHPNYMQNMAGKAFAFPTPKGSSGTGLIILEQVRTNCAPAAIINLRSDRPSDRKAFLRCKYSRCQYQRGRLCKARRRKRGRIF